MNKIFFDEAFKEAGISFDLNEVPIGAVIVKDDKIIASAHNMKEADQCSISHAEILAIKKACSLLNNWRLDGADIYVTLDPCPMCASAIKQSRISNVYSALSNTDVAYQNIISSIFNENDSTNSKVNFETNIFPEKSRMLLNKFFKKQRKN